MHTEKASFAKIQGTLVLLFQLEMGEVNVMNTMAKSNDQII